MDKKFVTSMLIAVPSLGITLVSFVTGFTILGWTVVIGFCIGGVTYIAFHR